MINSMSPAGTPAVPTSQAAPQTVVVRKPILGIIKGKIQAPSRILVYGPEGIGKSSLCASAEDVIFMCRESGTEQLDVQRLPECTHWKDAQPDKDGIRRDVWSQIEQIRHGEHGFKALAIDTLDWLEPLVFQHVIESDPERSKNKGKSIEGAYGGYGKGHVVALNEWRALLNQLDCIRKERGMHILLLAHSHIKAFNNPEGDNWDRYVLKMNEKAAGLFKEWCDAVLFANTEVLASKKSGGMGENKKMFGVSDNARYLFTNRRPAWDAKNRFGLPDKMALSWSELIKHIKTKAPKDIDSLITTAKEQMAFMSESDQSDAMAALVRAGRDSDKLAILINWIQSNQQ
jgi:hypothetical protein